jgi:hypothetical protein
MSGQLPGLELYDGGWRDVLQDLLTDLLYLRLGLSMCEQLVGIG